MRSESRSSLYYNAYEYAMTWQQDEIGCFRSLDQKKMQSHIRVRMEYEASRNSHYQRYGEKFESKFTTRCCDNLEGMRALLATETGACWGDRDAFQFGLKRVTPRTRLTATTK